MSDHYDRYNGMENLLGTNLASLGTDCISRQAAIDALDKLSESTYEVNYGVVDCDDAINAIAALPSTEPERKMGRWLPDNTDYYRTRFICSVCGESEEVPTMGFGYAPMWGYCPNCGAKMEVNNESN